MKLTFLAHASVLIEANGIKIVTDPWFDGPAYFKGWELNPPPPSNWKQILGEADYIYISHTHPDHLHPETLRHVAKNKPFIVPAFESDSVGSALWDLGFTNVSRVKAAERSQFDGYNTKDQFAIYLSGDGRDDSGLWVSDGNESCLLCTDANNLNHGVLPNVTYLCTAFAGGASGYPLCYDNFTMPEKATRAEHQRQAMMDYVSQYIAICQPKYWIPYAGFYSPHDPEIAKLEHKTGVDEISAFVRRKFPGVEIISPITPVLSTKPHVWQRQQQTHPLATYFLNSGYRKFLTLFIVPCDDNWEPAIGEDGCIVFFHEHTPPVCNILGATEANMAYDDPHTRGMICPQPVKKIKLKTEMLQRMIDEGLSWDDLLIGFHMRVHRVPDKYIPDLWRHFSIIYQGKRVTDAAA